MLERGTHDCAETLLTVELLEAAQCCEKSLQKALSLPCMASLCAELAKSLVHQSWKPRRHIRFAVREPKVREVFAPSFADRIVQTWLANRMEPILERTLIDDTYANRKNKGPLAAVCKARKYMRRPGHTWCMQLDVRGFFNSIHRPTLLRLWRATLNRQNLPEPTLNLMCFISTAILEHDATTGHRMVESSRELLSSLPPHKTLIHAGADTGLPIGSTTSQHFANFYLNSLDHFVKHELRVQGYIRYMDDLLLFGPDSETLCGRRNAISVFMKEELRLALHPDKEHIRPVTQGVEYLGYHVYPHYLHPCARIVNALKDRLDFFKHLLRPEAYPLCQRPVRGVWQGLAASGELTPPVTPDRSLLKRMEASINSYYGLMGHAQSYRLRKTLYHKHFGPLRAFFVPADAVYKSVHVKKQFLRL
jgi:hypothetical protein